MNVPSDKVFYLDSNIIVSYYFEDDDADQHNRILKCLEKISTNKNVTLIASTWTMTEANNALNKKIGEKFEKRVINNKVADYERNQASKFIRRLWINHELGSVKFEIKEFTKNLGDENFLFVEDFFDLVDDVVPLGNLTDALHCVIMNNFGVEKILTFNINDFEKFEDAIKDIKAVNPDDIDKYLGDG